MIIEDLLQYFNCLQYFQNQNNKRMLKSFIELDLSRKHDKTQYSIKKNRLILLGDNYSSSFRKPSPKKQCQTIYFDNSVDKQCLQKKQQKSIHFDCITYDYKTTNQKLLYQFLMLKPKQLKNTKTQKMLNQNFNYYDQDIRKQNQINKNVTMTITFNYDIQYQKLEQFFIQLMNIKKFQSSKFKIAHFQLRSNHISDYNKTQIRNKSRIDQMDTFTKQIDTCIKLDKTWKVKENIKFKQFNRQNFKEKDILNKKNRTNYQKKTNQFFICQIDDGLYQLNIIVFHRQKDFVLTKVQDKQIQQALILQKNQPSVFEQKQCQKMQVQFSSSLVLIIQSYLSQSLQTIFISQYPNPRNQTPLQQILYLPIRIGQSKPQFLQKIISNYNKEKENKIQMEMQKMKIKIRQLHHKKKTIQQNVDYLMKKYKQGFQGVFQALSYLRNNNITDIYSYKDNLKNQIHEKSQDIEDLLTQIKQIQLHIIQSQQRNGYYKQKMQLLKKSLNGDLRQLDASFNRRSLASKQNSSSQTPTKSGINKQKAVQKPIVTKQDQQIAQLMLSKLAQAQQKDNSFIIQLKRQVDRYKNQLRDKTCQKLSKCNQIIQFHSLMEDLRKRMTKHQFTKMEQKYLALISMC